VHYIKPKISPFVIPDSSTSSNASRVELLREIHRLRDEVRVLEKNNSVLHLRMNRAQNFVNQVSFGIYSSGFLAIFILHLFQRLNEIELQIGPEAEDEDESDTSNEVDLQPCEGGNYSFSNEEEADNNKESFI